MTPSSTASKIQIIPIRDVPEGNLKGDLKPARA